MIELPECLTLTVLTVLYSVLLLARATPKQTSYEIFGSTFDKDIV